MQVPQLKDESSLTRADFISHPVWVRVQDYDRDEPWHRDSTEQTYRPWNGPLPLKPKSQFAFVLLAGSFRLSSGRCCPGYFQAATEDWDAPIASRKMKDGTLTESTRWSSRHGGTPLSILALHHPAIFVGDKAYYFQLRRDAGLRRRCILDFYTAIGEAPDQVFPVEFSADPGLFKGIVSGRIDGFYTFPLNRPFEIDRGDRYLTEAK